MKSMKDNISQFVRSNLDSVKKNTESFVNYLKKLQEPAAKAAVLYLFFSMAMAMSQRCSSASSLRSLNNQDAAVTNTLNSSCDLATPRSKMFTELNKVELTESKLLNTYNVTYGVSLDTISPKYFTGDSQISNREMNVNKSHLTPLKEVTNEGSLLQPDQMEPSLVDKATTTSQDVKNQVFDVPVNKQSQAVQVLHLILDHFNRFYYVGTRAIERDPSRMELKDPLGHHEPTVVRVGSLQKSVRLPGIPKTRIIKWGNTGLEIMNMLVPKSSQIKPLTTCLVNNTTIGTFKSTTITREGQSIPSHVMYWRTFAEQHQHQLMVVQVRNMLSFMHPRQIMIQLHHLQHPDEPLLNPPVLNLDQLYMVALEVRATFIPSFIFREVPPFINTDGRVLVYNEQIKSISYGILHELKLLGPVFVLLRQENAWSKYIAEHFEISLRKTESNTMITSMVELQVNASKIGFEILNSLVSKTPIIKRAYPVINFVSSSVQEFFPIEVYIQRGKQHSRTTNFNYVQEHLRTQEMLNHNMDVSHGMGHHLVTFFRPINRRNSFTQLREIHDRDFYSIKWMIRYDFDLFEKLAKYTSPKNK